MILSETEFKGAYVIELEKQEDERGFFARAWDRVKFEEYDLNFNVMQCNISHNKMKGTLRGMHYQISPYEESKIIICTRGKMYDVIIDLRPESSTYKKWLGVELSNSNYKMLYVPKGFAHGFLTLENNTDVFYQMSEYYKPDYARGVRWNDKEFDITWPIHPSIISKKDSTYPSFKS